MIKELIFAGKKYYEGTVPNYIGKVIKNGGSNAYTISSETRPHKIRMEKINWTDPEGTIVGVIADYKNTIYVSTGEIQTDSVQLWHRVNDILQNGGVLGSLLIHICQAFKRAFTRNEVIACL